MQEEKRYLTVTALTKYIKYKFDHDFNLKDVYLEGEISNFKRHNRGHFYFTLKDENAAISVTMFVKDASKVLFDPKDGMNVLVKGNLTVYEPSGSYSINIYSMEQKGIGSLYLAYEKLKKELAEEGYFDQSHKREIPKFPKAIAVITSPTGAAVRDCINTIKRRYPLVQIYVYPTLVQGDDAKFSIIKNIEKCNQDNLVDTIILGRGGGSIEDLWAFNERIVIEAIYKSRIPIITGVGHETDTTLSDFVSDKRAATPTAAAELATPNIANLQELVDNYRRYLDNYIKSYMDSIKERLVQIDRHLDLLSPISRLEKMHQRVDELKKLLDVLIVGIVEDKGHKLNLLKEKMNALNPLSIMDKGFSMVVKDDKIVKSIKDVKKDDILDINLKDGKVSAKVLEVVDERS